MKITWDKLFATMRADPGINADDVALSCGSFLTCSREKYIQYYTVMQ
jgi:hypothetical protein